MEVSKNDVKKKMRRAGPQFEMFQKVWRIYGDRQMPAIVFGHPIVRYNDENEFIDILLIFRGFCVLRSVPSHFLKPVACTDGDAWSYGWDGEFSALQEQPEPNSPGPSSALT